MTRLPELSNNILRITQEQKQITISELQTYTKANRNTIKKHVQALVKDNYLEIHGTGKGTFYTKKL